MDRKDLIVGCKYINTKQRDYVVTIKEVNHDDNSIIDEPPGYVVLEEEPGRWAISHKKYGGFLGNFEPLEIK